MKEIELSDATGTLADYARGANPDEPLVVTRNGKPVAAVVSLKGVDAETLALSNNPRFLKILDRSRARYAREGGLTPDEVRRQLNLATGNRRTRRTSKK